MLAIPLRINGAVKARLAKRLSVHFDARSAAYQHPAAAPVAHWVRAIRAKQQLGVQVGNVAHSMRLFGPIHVGWLHLLMAKLFLACPSLLHSIPPKHLHLVGLGNCRLPSDFTFGPRWATNAGRTRHAEEARRATDGVKAFATQHWVVAAKGKTAAGTGAFWLGNAGTGRTFGENGTFQGSFISCAPLQVFSHSIELTKLLPFPSHPVK